MKNLVLGLVSSALLAGCFASGKEFTRPVESVVFGTTTRHEIVAQYGEPVSRNKQVLSMETALGSGAGSTAFDPAPVGGVMETLAYSYTNRTRSFWIGGPPNMKAVTFKFWNDTLIAYYFISNLTEEQTRGLDDKAINSIVRGQTTRHDLERTFGKPSSAAIYPAILRPEQQQLSYTYFAIGRFSRELRRLDVIVDRQGVVQDLRFSVEK